ncbi:MAG: demethoxyubiquinone hydroxylase family protein [Chloroflexi bacterium]|nr:demethoxyubiquinone hydroxylase family protein [Chloroflexota bacterium]
MGELADPFKIGLVPRKLTDEELARAVRMDVAAEIEAVNLYEAHIAATDNEMAKRVIGHILQEEREHLIEFLELAKQLDPRQVEAEIEAKAQFPLVAAGQSENPAAEARSEGTRGSGLTVGSLIGEDQAT